MRNDSLGKALGWFSIGLGVAALLAPRKTERLVGLRKSGCERNLLGFVGAREITSGLGLLAQPSKPGWLWARVAGDIMDLALLGSAFKYSNKNTRRLAVTTAAVAGVTALDVYASTRTSRHQANGHDRTEKKPGKEVHKSIVINRPVSEIYSFWRNFENLPRFMTHLKQVRNTGERTSHWEAKAPLGTTVAWDAEVTEDWQNKRIAWRSLPGSTVETEGAVWFEEAPGGRGTIVRIDMRYNPPGGKAGATIAKLLGQAPEKQIPVDLLRFKQLLETGEIARTEGQPTGRGAKPSKIDTLVRA